MILDVEYLGYFYSYNLLKIDKISSLVLEFVDFLSWLSKASIHMVCLVLRY